MYDLAVTLGLIAAAGLFAYLAMHPTDESKFLRFMFLIMSLVFIYNALGTIYVFSYNSGIQLINTSHEDGAFWNCSFGGNSNSTCSDVNVTYSYSELGSYQNMTGTVLAPMVITQYLILFLIFLFLLLLLVAAMKRLREGDISFEMN